MKRRQLNVPLWGETLADEDERATLTLGLEDPREPIRSGPSGNDFETISGLPGL